MGAEKLIKARKCAKGIDVGMTGPFQHRHLLRLGRGFEERFSQGERDDLVICAMQDENWRANR